MRTPTLSKVVEVDPDHALGQVSYIILHTFFLKAIFILLSSSDAKAFV